MQKPEDKIDFHPVTQKDCNNDENATAPIADQDVNIWPSLVWTVSQVVKQQF